MSSPPRPASRAGTGSRRRRTMRWCRRWPHALPGRCRRPTASPRSSSAPTASSEIKKQTIEALTARRCRNGLPRRSASSCSSSRATSCASASWRASRASTGAIPSPCGRSRSRSGVLSRTHGSALFTRGETQALVTTTLGTTRDAQIIDALEGERREPFMLHYNFPPFSVGETGMMGSPKRREIGHGNLARRGVQRRDARHDHVPVRHPRGVGDSRIQRLELHGERVRHQPVADGRRRADQGTGGRRGHGPGARGCALPGAHRHPRRRGSPGRHGFQGRRHARWRHRAADGHQGRGHYAGDHARGARRRRVLAGCTYSTRWRR